jgi:mRNA-degrading endonuclease toxin of MazEF toxin-antitoxin module
MSRRAAALRSLALLCILLPATAAPVTTPARRAESELALRREESGLLHRAVDLSELARFSFGERNPDRAFTPERPGLAPVTVLHIWAVECHACVEEFGVLRQVVDSFARTWDVKFMLLSETEDPRTLMTFLEGRAKEVPRADHYQIRGERLRAGLQNRTQPTTLLLDQRGLIRQALLGSLMNRRNELVEGITRLARNLKEGAANRPVIQLDEAPRGQIPEAIARELTLRRTEDFLLHGKLALPSIAPPPWRAKRRPVITVVHVWTRAAGDDLPLVARVAHSFRRQPAVRFLFLCDAADEAEQQEAGDRMREVAPDMPYACASPSLRRALGARSRPLTLLLDDQQIVRQVIAGPLVGALDRRNELADSIERLVRGAKVR